MQQDLSHMIGALIWKEGQRVALRRWHRDMHWKLCVVLPLPNDCRVSSLNAKEKGKVIWHIHTYLFEEGDKRAQQMVMHKPLIHFSYPSSQGTNIWWHFFFMTHESTWGMWIMSALMWLRAISASSGARCSCLCLPWCQVNHSRRAVGWCTWLSFYKK